MSAMCDVCSMPTDSSKGYAFTTTEVTTESKYWEFMIDRHSFDEDLLMMYVQQQAMQCTGWLICESCSKLFSFNKSVSKGYAQRMENPPGCGVADINYVAAAAARAWKKKNGTLPSWVG